MQPAAPATTERLKQSIALATVAAIHSLPAAPEAAPEAASAAPATTERLKQSVALATVAAIHSLPAVSEAAVTAPSVAVSDTTDRLKQSAALATVSTIAPPVAPPAPQLQQEIAFLQKSPKGKSTISNTADIDNVWIPKHYGQQKAGGAPLTVRAPVSRYIQDPLLSNMNIYNTEGAGTCLVHAFLLDVSEQYRRSQNRKEIGEAFRVFQLAQHAKTLEDFTFIRNVANWLTEDHIQLLATSYKVNILVFAHSRDNAPLYTNIYVGNPGGDYILIWNDSRVHYEAVGTSAGFTIPAESAMQIHAKYDILLQTRKTVSEGDLRRSAALATVSALLPKSSRRFTRKRGRKSAA